MLIFRSRYHPGHREYRNLGIPMLVGMFGSVMGLLKNCRLYKKEKKKQEKKEEEGRTRKKNKKNIGVAED